MSCFSCSAVASLAADEFFFSFFSGVGVRGQPLKTRSEGTLQYLVNLAIPHWPCTIIFEAARGRPPWKWHHDVWCRPLPSISSPWGPPKHVLILFLVGDIPGGSCGHNGIIQWWMLTDHYIYICKRTSKCPNILPSQQKANICWLQSLVSDSWQTPKPTRLKFTKYISMGVKNREKTIVRRPHKPTGVRPFLEKPVPWRGTNRQGTNALVLLWKPLLQVVYQSKKSPVSPDPSQLTFFFTFNGAPGVVQSSEFPSVRICLELRQVANNLRKAPRGCMIQSSYFVYVDGMRIGTNLHQKADNVHSRSRLCHNRFQLGSEPCPKGYVRLRSVQTHWQAHPCWLPPPQESGQRLHGRHKLWLSMALTHLRRPDLSSRHFGPKNEQPQRFPYRAAVFKGVIPSPLDGTSWYIYGTCQQQPHGLNMSVLCCMVQGCHAQTISSVWTSWALQQLFKTNCIVASRCNHNLFVFCHIWWAKIPRPPAEPLQALR